MPTFTAQMQTKTISILVAANNHSSQLPPSSRRDFRRVYMVGTEVFGFHFSRVNGGACHIFIVYDYGCRQFKKCVDEEFVQGKGP